MKINKLDNVEVNLETGHKVAIADIKEGEKFMGMLILEKDYVVFTLNEDGTGTATHDGEEEIFTWTKTDDIIAMIDDEGEIIYATWSARKLVLEEYEDGITMQITLKK